MTTNYIGNARLWWPENTGPRRADKLNPADPNTPVGVIYPDDKTQIAELRRTSEGQGITSIWDGINTGRIPKGAPVHVNVQGGEICSISLEAE